MKVHLIRKESIELFCALNVQSRNAFVVWLNKIKYADWTIPTDIISTFPTTDFLGNGSNKIVFDIGGNKYRIIIKYVFGKKQIHLFICWIGTHADYDKLKTYFMETLKYKVIHTSKEYQAYCTILENLVGAQDMTPSLQDEIELLTLLIENWDAAHNTFHDVDPIQLLKSLMKSNGLKSKDLVQLLGMSKGYISDILNYKKGLSKTAIRILANHFKVAQEAFNRPYDLTGLTIKNNTETNLVFSN